MEKLPSKPQIVQWLADNPTLTSKRDIARAFGIKGGELRIELKRMLKELEDEGALLRKQRQYRDPDALPLPLSDMAAVPSAPLMRRFYALSFAATQVWRGL